MAKERVATHERFEGGDERGGFTVEEYVWCE